MAGLAARRAGRDIIANGNPRLNQMDALWNGLKYVTLGPNTTRRVTNIIGSFVITPRHVTI